LGVDYYNPNQRQSVDDRRSAAQFLFLPGGNQGGRRAANEFFDGIPRTEPNVLLRPRHSSFYSVVMEAKLRPGTYTAADANHFRQANRQLHSFMQENPEFTKALEREFPGITTHVTPGPRGGVADTPPPGLQWHHDPHLPGNLQLVPGPHHRAAGPVQQSLHPNQKGGREIWGGGTTNR
jgi:hypothetical protein